VCTSFSSGVLAITSDKKVVGVRFRAPLQKDLHFWPDPNQYKK
jgi:hypothetical protein